MAVSAAAVLKAPGYKPGIDLQCYVAAAAAGLVKDFSGVSQASLNSEMCTVYNGSGLHQ